MLPFRSGHARNGASLALFASIFFSGLVLAADPSPRPQKTGSLINIPLPIGQEAKGLVLPDFDLEGRLRARFEAGTAKRLDTEQVEFRSLKMTTFTPQSTPDLLVDMPLAILNLNSQVIASRERTTVSRRDFTISGDTMRFDTVARKGTLVGNVKMVITGQPAAENSGQ